MLTFHLIPHTHWDREWYLPRAAFVARLVPMLDDLIARLEADPPFRTFLLDGQTILVDDYLAVRRDREAAVRALVRSGRLQVGPWYVLADEIIPSAESLVRNLLIGAAQSAALGARTDVLYSPDAFGHPASLPSLAREFGIERAVIWRGLAGGRDLVDWSAPDGAEILTYHLPPAGYEIGAALSAEPERLAVEWPAIRATLVGRAASREVAVFVGADHHAAHPAIGRLRASLAALEPDHEVRISRLDEFFGAVERDHPRVEAVRGELRASCGYTWTLQGIHATRAPLKRRSAKCELWLQRFAEPLAAVADRGGGLDRRPLLASAWRELVQCHFHDTIGGCSADAVADETAVRLTSVEATARELVRASLHEVTGYEPDLARTRVLPDEGALLLWNPAARPRAGVAVADVAFFRTDVFVGPPAGRVARTGPGFRPFALRSADGTTFPVQVLEVRRGVDRLDAAHHYPDLDLVDVVRVAFDAPSVPGLGIHVLQRTAPAASAPPARVNARGARLTNEHISVEVTDGGTLTLTDIATGERYAGLLAFESEEDAGDTYTFAPGKRRTLRPRGRPAIRLLAAGPLVGIVDARWSFDDVDVRLRVLLHAGERFVRCVLDSENRGTNRRLRARLPVGIRAESALAGAHFGAAERAVARPEDCQSEAAVRTAPAQRYAAAASNDRGLAVLAPGFFEYEWTGSDLLVTLLRSVGDLSRGDLATRPGHAGWITPTPGAQCLGHDRIELAIAPVTSANRTEAALNALWEDAVLPVRTSWLRGAADLAPASSSIDLVGDGLILSALKPTEDGIGVIVRCYNATDRAVDGTLSVAPPPVHAERSMADERPGAQLEINDVGRIPFRAGPREIVTIRLR